MFASRLLISGCVVLALGFTAPANGQEKLNVPPPGFTALFNGKDLSGWKGLPLKPNMNAKKKESQPYVAMSMPERLKASPAELAEAQQRGDESAHEHWKVENGVLVFDGKGQNLCTAKDYGDFEMHVDWKINEHADSGIYLRGSPQVQIWDPKDPNQLKNGCDKGSGALWNNQKNPRFPNVVADNSIGEWNTFHIKMVGEKVTIHLNGKLVTDNVTMENVWERDKPIYPKGAIELQNHGNTLYFRNIYVKELPRQ
jgi:hypothetical protein